MCSRRCLRVPRRHSRERRAPRQSVGKVNLTLFAANIGPRSRPRPKPGPFALVEHVKGTPPRFGEQNNDEEDDRIRGQVLQRDIASINHRKVLFW